MSLGNFLKLLRFGFVFSVSPWYDADKKAFKYQTFNRAYSFFLTAFFLALFVFGVVHLEWNNNAGFLSGKFLSFEIIGATSMATMYLLLRLNRKKMNAWKRLLDNLLAIEEILHGAFGVTLTESFHYLLIPTQVPIIAGNLYYYTFYYMKHKELFNEEEGNAYEKMIVRLWLDVTRYISLLVCVISAALMKILCNRLVALNSQIKRMQRTGERKREILALKICYARLLDNIRLYNEIFGNFVFCSIVKTTVEFQVFLTFLTQNEHLQDSSSPIHYTFKSASSSLLSWFCSIYIIFSCEFVTKELAETRKNCFELYLRSLDDWSIDSQRNVSDVVELLASNPKFTAGKFFEIRREIVLNILDVAAAYVLATVQLKGKN